MHDFTSIDFQSSKPYSSKINFVKESLWLNFLVSLSFSNDGQQLFLKVENLLNAIINLFELYTNNSNINNIMTSSISNTNILNSSIHQNDIAYLALLILRNVSFNQANKSKLISQGNEIIHKIHFYFLNFFLFQ